MLVVIGLVGFTSRSLAQPGPGEAKRALTVADTIRLTRVAGPLFASGYSGVGPQRGFAVFSPNGKGFAIVTSKGNLENNTNDYSLLLFRTSDVPRGARPKILVTFASSSNREGISGLSWRADNETILFLGARGKNVTQLYAIKCSSGRLAKLTNHRTSLVSYAMSRGGGSVVYAAESPETKAVDEKVLHYGFHVASETLYDLVRGELYSPEPQLFLKGNGAGGEKRLRTRNPFDSGVNDLFLSPNGRYLVLKTDATDVPPSWSQYVDENIRAVVRRKPAPGTPSRILQFELMDTQTGHSEVLLDAPTTYSPADVLWSPDSQSVLLCSTYLPLGGEDLAEIQARRTNRFVLEVKLRGRQAVKVTNEDLSPVRWDALTNVVEFRIASNQEIAGNLPELLYYRRVNRSWERLAANAHANNGWPEILVDQDLNVAPQIVAVDPATKRRTLLLDLNPQLARLALGRVEEIEWMDNGAKPVIGGLYLPTDYVAGKRYPLVIQTHGFRQHEFWIDGAHTTVFAARALAGSGIAVLQVNDIFYDSLDTPQEPERAMAVYENAVNYLDQRGIIDPKHVGIVGFSRTCLYVKYALTHSSLHFQAAIVADGFDVGYWQYLLHNQAIWTSEIESVVGAPPFGDGLSTWLKRSPGFLLDRVQTPLQIQALSPSSLLGEWDWFSGLKRLHKPVDLVYLPDGTHILVKPWERMVSQDGGVDWFRFWLKEEEDSNLEKLQQFVRWRALRRELAECSGTGGLCKKMK